MKEEEDKNLVEYSYTRDSSLDFVTKSLQDYEGLSPAIEKYHDKWIPNIITDMKQGTTSSLSKDHTIRLLQQVIVEYARLKHEEDSIIKNVKYHNELKKVIKKLKYIVHFLEPHKINIIINPAEMLGDVDFVNKVNKVSKENISNIETEDLLERLLTSTFSSPSILLAWLEWEEKKYSRTKKNINKKTNKNNSQSCHTFIGELLKLLFTLQGVKPSSTTTTPVTIDKYGDHNSTIYKTKNKHLKTFDFIKEGVELIGITLKDDQIIKKIKSGIKNINWDADNTRLKNNIIISEEQYDEWVKQLSDEE